MKVAADIDFALYVKNNLLFFPQIFKTRNKDE